VNPRHDIAPYDVSTTRFIAEDRRPQLAASFSNYLRPAAVNE
jgi:hypothetical protein